MFRRLNHCHVRGYAPICLDSNDPATVEAALLKRLMRDLPQADPGLLESFAMFVRVFCMENIARVTPKSFAQWLAESPYNQERRAQIQLAYDMLRGGRPTLKQCRKIQAFIKTEFYKCFKHARMINSRCDAFKAWSGRLFKAIEDEVYSLPEFIKHIPVPERPARIAAMRKAGRYYYATDFTAYESHFIPIFMRSCECILYEWCLQDQKDAHFITKVLTGVNEIKTRTGIKAKVEGRRMSGDMCTSLGNGFTNLMLVKYIVASKGGECGGFVEGDDGLFWSTVPITAEDYAALGFTIKIEQINDPCEASFCGMIFAESGQIIKDPRKFLQGFGWTSSFINAGPKIMDELLRAKALSACYETPQCPIIGAMARHALSLTRGANPRFVDDGYHYNVPTDESNIPAFAPSSDTRMLFEAQFGIPVQTQLQIEAAIWEDDMDRVSELTLACTAFEPVSATEASKRESTDTTRHCSDYATMYVIVT